ncbi:MAG: glycoside hydrolase family 3 N-terminal domain-containing protein [Cryomorphaceae bacterium]
MIKQEYIALLFLAVIAVQGCDPIEKNAPGEAKGNPVDSLLKMMTLEEKAGQMTNVSLMTLAEGDFWMKRDTVILSPEKMKVILADNFVGSVQNLGTYPFSPKEWRQNIGLVQDYARENTRLQIPVIYGIDAVHGANYTAGSTLFPHQLGLAATWNTKLSREMGRITAYEMKASGIPWNYGPVLDVSTQPLWGRIFETFGEDTYITSQMGNAMIEGMQGDSISDKYSAAVCLKHFLGYGSPHNGKDRSPAYIPERRLREIYMPPFQEAINNGAKTVMLNSGSLNGVPSHSDKWLITEILKGEMGFTGFTISDWEDVTNLHKVHQVVKTEKEAVKLAVNSGLDMCMAPYDAGFAQLLVELVNEGEVKESRVDDAVRRILQVKFDLGLFDEVLTDPQDYPKFGSEAFADASLKAAEESITLLKNTGNILPLAKDQRVFVTGVAGNSLNYLNGAWSRTWSGEVGDYNDPNKKTIHEAVMSLAETTMTFVQGTDYTEDVNIEKAVAAAKTADVVVVCLGEKPATEKPSDIEDLEMPKAQLNLVKKLAATGKPVILVLVEARPRVISEVEPLADATLMAYLPGNEGGRAIANILFGDVNPSGKLPLTYPRHTGSIWTYNHTRADKRDAGFGFDAFNPQYEFGHGLSYTSFAYSDFELSADTSDLSAPISLKVTVQNTGNRTGKEVVQLYSSDLVASVVPAVRSLKRFKKIELEPGEAKDVAFELNASDFAFVNTENEWVAEAGDFTFSIDTLEANFYLKNNTEFDSN